MFRFTLRSATTLPIELAGIVPDVLRGKSIGKIQRFPIWHGRTKVPLADLFAVERDEIEDQCEFIGDLTGSVGLGSGMKSGIIRVEGNAGRNVGVAMWGGEIEVVGNAGDGLGTEMHGGTIRVRGSAGNAIGATEIGSTLGMAGGTILIGENAGDGVGTHMRRGIIAIAGRAGDLLGHKMLAGTIIVGGKCGRHVGVGMNRGTIGLLSSNEDNLPSTFRYACSAHFPMLGLVGRELQSLGFENDVWNANRRWRQFSGDFLISGRGEVFVATPQL